MKLINREVEAIAGAMADKANKEQEVAIKTRKNLPAFKKEVTKWLNHIKKMPDELQEKFAGNRHKLCYKSVEDALYDNSNDKYYRSSQFEQQVRLAAMECKNLNELKTKLGITF